MFTEVCGIGKGLDPNIRPKKQVIKPIIALWSERSISN